MSVDVTIENASVGQNGQGHVVCKFAGDRIEGNFFLTMSKEELTRAMTDNTLEQLVKVKFASINDAAVKGLNQQLTELTKENQVLKQQMNMSNLSTLMMINELEKKIPKVEENTELEEPVEDVEEQMYPISVEEANEDNNNIIDN